MREFFNSVRRYWWRLLLPSLLVAAALLLGVISLLQPHWAGSPEKAELQWGIELASDYLVDACGPDGRFRYLARLDNRPVNPRAYNMLRHCGTIYSMGMAFQRKPAAKTEEAMLRAVSFIKRESLAPLLPDSNLLAIWSSPELGGYRRQVKLGGLGLGLVALCAMERARPGTTHLDTLRAVGQAIEHLQKADGGFYSKFYPGQRGRDDSWTSLYYPGEACLGLVMLYELDGNPRWLIAAGRTLGYLAESRKGQLHVPADHWALLASKRYLRHAAGAGSQLLAQLPPPSLVRGHAVEVVRAILRERWPFHTDPDLAGAAYIVGTTTPTATRLEGMIAALDVVPQERRRLRKTMFKAIDMGTAFLLRAQVREGEMAGAFPRAIKPMPWWYLYNRDEFNSRVHEVRIDYVQHALSAMIQYEEMQAWSPSPSPH